MNFSIPKRRRKDRTDFAAGYVFHAAFDFVIEYALARFWQSLGIEPA